MGVAHSHHNVAQSFPDTGGQSCTFTSGVTQSAQLRVQRHQCSPDGMRRCPGQVASRHGQSSALNKRVITIPCDLLNIMVSVGVSTALVNSIPRPQLISIIRCWRRINFLQAHRPQHQTCVFQSKNFQDADMHPTLISVSFSPRSQTMCPHVLALQLIKRQLLSLFRHAAFECRKSLTVYCRYLHRKHQGRVGRTLDTLKQTVRGGHETWSGTSCNTNTRLIQKLRCLLATNQCSLLE